MKKRIALTLLLALLLTGCNYTAPTATPAAADLLPQTVYSLTSHPLTQTPTLPTQVCLAGENLYFIAGSPTEETALFRLDLATQDLSRLATYAAQNENAESFTAVAEIFAGEDGTVWLMENTTHYIFDLPRDYNEDSHNKWEYYQYRGDTTVMRQLGAAGQQLHAFTLVNLQSSLNAAVQAGEYILCAQGQDLLFLTTEGELAATVTAPGWISDLALDGDTVCIMTDHEEDSVSRLYRLDMETYTLDEGAPLPMSVYSHAGLSDHTLYFTERSNLFAWDFTEGTGKKLLDWMDYGRNRSHISHVFVLPDGLAALSQTAPDETPELLLLTPSETPRPAADLTLGVLWPDDNVVDLVLSFNAANHGGNIRMADYSEYDALGQNGTDMLRLDLAGGTGPDLLFSPDETLPITTVAENFLQDLTPYLEKDQSLHHQGLMTSVFDALRTEDGKLYSVASSFQLFTAIGRGDLLRPTPMDTERMLQLAEGLEADSFAPIEPYITRQTAFAEHLSRLSGTYFSGETPNFTAETLASGLDLAALYPEVLDWNRYEKKNIAESWYRVRTGRQLFLSDSYARFAELAEDMSLVGEDAVLCGWPDTPGGHALQVSESWGITISCRRESLAWAFLRTVLTDTYQTSHTLSGLPTNRSAFSRLGRAAMQSGGINYSPGGKETIEFSTQLTQSQYDAILSAVDSAETLSRPLPMGLDAAIYNAVSGYFTGVLTAEEAAIAANAAVTQYYQ